VDLSTPRSHSLDMAQHNKFLHATVERIDATSSDIVPKARQLTDAADVTFVGQRAVKVIDPRARLKACCGINQLKTHEGFSI
jgi:hypothetical protein